MRKGETLAGGATSQWTQHWRGLFTLLFGTVAPLLSTDSALGQIFVSNWIDNRIGEYATTGAVVSPTKISDASSGLYAPWGMTESGGYLYVANYTPGTIGVFTTAGQTVNPALISGLVGPEWISISGDDIFVVDQFGTVGKYTIEGATIDPALLTTPVRSVRGIATTGGDLFVVNQDAGTVSEYTSTGAVVNPALLTGIFGHAIAVSGDKIFVANSFTSIGEYTTSGATVNASLITGLSGPSAIAVFGDKLFVLDSGNSGVGTVGEYTTSGTTVNALLITGYYYPQGMVVVSPLLGDVNYNGLVNGQDIAQIATHWMQSGTSLSDTNGDGIVNGEDISLLAANWLHTVPGGGGAAVPEPSTLFLAALGGIALLTCRQWQR